ncbi:MAG: Uncharacterised protein [Porticoccaceae bacterium UBA1117]|nr:MAG: Uncharacterised protein [Porticoccaceae bacterium UBA1117]
MIKLAFVVIDLPLLKVFGRFVLVWTRKFVINNPANTIINKCPIDD